MHFYRKIVPAICPTNQALVTPGQKPLPSEGSPTSWDETRLLTGEVGQYVVIARRKKGLLAFRRHDDEQAAFLNNGQRVPGKMAARQQPSPVPGRAAIVLNSTTR